jgi:hypothetical protein
MPSVSAASVDGKVDPHSYLLDVTVRSDTKQHTYGSFGGAFVVDRIVTFGYND